MKSLSFSIFGFRTGRTIAGNWATIGVVLVLLTAPSTAQQRRPQRPEAQHAGASGVPPNPPGFLKVDLSLAKGSKDKGLIKLLFDYIPGDEIDEIKDQTIQNISVLYLWDLGPSNQVLPSTRVRFYYSVFERIRAGGLQEFPFAKPRNAPIEVRQTRGDGLPAQSIFNRLAIVFVPRIEVVQIKNEDGQRSTVDGENRYFEYFPATIVVHDKVFSPNRRPETESAVLPSLQIWRVTLEKSPIREEMNRMFEFMRATPNPECKSCLDNDKVVFIKERPDFGKYLEECDKFWKAVRQQWGVR